MRNNFLYLFQKNKNKLTDADSSQNHQFSNGGETIPSKKERKKGKKKPNNNFTNSILLIIYQSEATDN